MTPTESASAKPASPQNGRSSSANSPATHPAGTQAVFRALSLFEFICRSEGAVSLDEATAWISLPKSTTFRLLQALASFGLVTQDDTTHRYRPGMRLFELYNLSVGKLDVFQEAKPVLRDLCAQFNETVHLGVLDAGQVVYVDKEESSRAVRMFSAVGKRAPAHCTGIGKALLAHMSQAELAETLALQQLERFTDRTLASPDDLITELALIRSRGYAIDDGEHEDDIRCVAAPIRNAAGDVVAAMSLTMPAERFGRLDLSELISAVQGGAETISTRLGHVNADRGGQV